MQGNASFRDKAPVSAAQAATVILDGVRSGAWRILIGEDARKLDAAVRAQPEAAYDYAELFSGLAEGGRRNTLSDATVSLRAGPRSGALARAHARRTGQILTS